MSNQVVLTVTPSVLEEMKHYYHSNSTPKVPQGGVFTAKTAGCTITAYKSGKVMFQGTGAAGEASRWGSAPSAAAKPKKTTGYEPPAGISSMSIIGSDEVGTGDFFGPITVVAAYVEKEQIPLLRELGVRDSKGLADEQISAIAKQLLPIVTYSLLSLSNEKYNELQQGGKNQGELKALLHNKAIGNVLEKIHPKKPEGILIDQFVQPDTYYKYLGKQKAVHRENVYFSIKGESVHLAVAAASILARYAFVQKFEELSRKAGFTLPKGAGSQVDQAAAKLIRMHGEASLKEFAKLHFANTDKAKRYLK
ncbi:ribonuclease HIII [Ectobacillus ponti]|uniref:Ribonuclease HIII n=1 Tax=Ectobacillus ponti TaxID=2961894 RepID=A0AA42BNG0_9BACI|nr:ribonuclease HIII [Ectobacillus ponti]MCP8967391.1 ribonuclease HIII [Ectobacillus ponti]